MDERMRFVIRLKDGETMASLCREFGISRKAGYKIFERYEQCGRGRALPAHCGCASPDSILQMECWSKRWSAPEWRSFLAKAESAKEVAALRQFTHTGRPLGTQEFVSGLEASMLRPLAARKPGRPNKAAPNPHQLSLISGA